MTGKDMYIVLSNHIISCHNIMAREYSWLAEHICSAAADDRRNAATAAGDGTSPVSETFSTHRKLKRMVN